MASMPFIITGFFGTFLLRLVKKAAAERAGSNPAEMLDTGP
jgi:hypothetical protein